jgi:hypothetical protein
MPVVFDYLSIKEEKTKEEKKEDKEKEDKDDFCKTKDNFRPGALVSRHILSIYQ